MSNALQCIPFTCNLSSKHYNLLQVDCLHLANEITDMRRLCDLPKVSQVINGVDLTTLQEII